MDRIEGHLVIPTSAPPTEPARLVDDFTPALLDVGEHHLCPGCGEPIAMRSALEAIAELGVIQRTIAVFGIGCYTAFANNLDVEVLQALHGRAPSLATGAKRAKPNTVVFTVQGDGDMVNEGLQEVLHAAARGENITCIMLNNGVFGETGGHMTATTVLGQRTKNTLDGRDADRARLPHSVEQSDRGAGGRGLRRAWCGEQCGQRRPHEEDVAACLRDTARGGGLLVRRDTHDVPNRLVHRDAGITRLPRGTSRGGALAGRAQGRHPALERPA